MGDKNDSPYIYKSTPPPSNRRIRNPFDKGLIDKLHKPLCSPGMCKVYKKKSTGGFRWDIDQHCTLVPTDIVACSSQFEPSPDPALEKIAEEATENTKSPDVALTDPLSNSTHQFFSQEMVMPSPMESSKKVKPLYTSCDASIQIDCIKETIVTRDAQTVLTLPPELPPELEKLLQPFCTFTQDQNLSGENEISANGSLRRKLYFDEHSDMEHYDSEQTDDEILVEPRPPSSFEAHSPVVFSPDISQNFSAPGMRRTFGTPLKKGPSTSKQHYRNKILDVADFGEPCFSPIEFCTPKRDLDSAASSSLASTSISPVTKAASSDDEKNNFTSPESEAMAICLDCVTAAADDKKEERGPCFCKITPKKIILKRSASLKDSPARSRKGSMSEKRSLSMSSLHRSKSVQKLDFTMDMSVDGSLLDHSRADSDLSPVEDKDSWSIVEESTIQQLVKTESFTTQLNEIQSSTKLHSVNLNMLDNTPIKGKIIRTTHKISKITASEPRPLHMSFDSSLSDDNPLDLEDKKVDFNSVDLKFLTENVTQFNYVTSNATTVAEDVSTSFKRVDSGFNEHTFCTNASSYYESAIKPSELMVTNVSNKTAFKELSNVNWMRVDSGFKDENSTDSMHFYNNENAGKKFPVYHFSEAKLDGKENTEDFDRFLVQSNKNEAMSMSEIFSDDMTFNCNFSSTPSKNKLRKVNS